MEEKKYEDRQHTGYTKADEHLARALDEGDQQFEQERKKLYPSGPPPKIKLDEPKIVEPKIVEPKVIKPKIEVRVEPIIKKIYDPINLLNPYGNYNVIRDEYLKAKIRRDLEDEMKKKEKNNERKEFEDNIMKEL